jgi:type IV pilus assembly protein PilO
MDTAELVEKVEKIKMPYRVLILVGTLIVLVGLFVWLVHIPKTKEIARLKTSNASLMARITEAKQKTKDIKEFEKDVAEVEEQYKEALTLLPKKEEIPTLLVNVTELGTTSNLEFKSFSPAKGADDQMFTEIPVAIQVTGKYHDVLLFFDRVGKMKRIVNIKDVTMSPKGEEDTDLNVTCKAITYKFRE